MRQTLLILLVALTTQAAKAEDYKYLTVSCNDQERSIALETALKITFRDGNVVVTTCDDTYNFSLTDTQRIFFSATATGIEKVGSRSGEDTANGKLAEGEYYDLSGRRVSHPAKGLYIVGQKKVLIK